MKTYRITLNLKSAFATPLKGDTLFGQLCWAIRNRLGENHLTGLLDGYTCGQPFAVVSDAFPHDYLPLPKLPGRFYGKIDGVDRKAVKKRCWLPEEAASSVPVTQWLAQAKTASDVIGQAKSLSEKHPQAHNTINRQTHTTGEGGFAPYSIEQEWFLTSVAWTIYLLLDTERLSQDDCRQCLEDIGNIGFGRDASIGLGKFSVSGFSETTLPGQTGGTACLTLAPCAPQGLGFDGKNSFYQLFTRFGRHGDIAVHQEGKPFKNPVLLAQTAAVFAVQPPETGFIGQGIGDNGKLSKTLAATVHQGYAPSIAIHLDTQERT